jgi:RNA polymerase sigma factor (sigma-70 family)
MDELGVQTETDPLLLPFLNAGAEAEALDLLTALIRGHAEPVIKAIIGHKLRVFLDGRAAQEAEDVHGDVVLQLLAKLRELKADQGARGIGNFRSYVAVTTHHACHEYLRRKYPQRWRLKNRLRYLLTHHETFALWGDEGEEWLCGFGAWRGRRKGAVEASRLEGLRDAQRASERLGLAGRNLQLINLAELLDSIFKYLNAPVELDALVTVVADLQVVKDLPEQPAGDEGEEGVEYEQTPDPRADVGREVEQRIDVARLWEEICQLPVRQRAALLLNLKGAAAADAIALFPLTGAASIRQIASALEIDAEEFAALWNELPLDDAAVAARLGVTRQQVINLRKSARERLSRRMKDF